MDHASLQKLNRSALQTLAKEHNIKANLKSSIIIELLLQLVSKISNSTPDNACRSPLNSPERRSLQSTPRKREGHETPSVPRKLQTHNNISDVTTHHHQVLNDTSHGARRGPLPPADGDDVSESDIDILNRCELQYPPSIATSASTYTFGTPASSPVRSHIPEAPSKELRKAVELMANIHSDDLAVLEEIHACREVAARARSQAEALKKRAAAARAVRERLQKYALYWRWISPTWTFEEVWKGKMTVKRVGIESIEITSSDDDERGGEGEGEKEVDSQNTTKGNADDQERGESAATLQPASSGALDDALRSLKAAGPSGHRNGKHRREVDAEVLEDEDRYQPRRRSPGLSRKSSHARTTPPPSHNQKRADKGKGKMSLVDIEEMLAENGGEWDVHAMTRHEAELNSKDLMTVLRVSDEQAQYDNAVTQQAKRATREQFRRLPATGGPPTWHIPEPTQPTAPSRLRTTRRLKSRGK